MNLGPRVFYPKNAQASSSRPHPIHTMTTAFTLFRSCPSLAGWPRRATRAVAAVFLLLSPFGASAQYAAAESVSANDRALLAQMARDWLEPALGTTLAENPDNVLRPEVIMGALDSRLRLAPCQQIEPYLPPGTRLWGRSRIGLRCLQGRVHWNIYVPVTIKAWGPAWVLRRAVAGGTLLTPEDADLAEMDWAEQSASVLATPESWVGQQTAFALHPGQALRANMVRPVPTFTRGAQVRVRSVGSGLHVVVSGVALDVGVLGQPARVKLAGGRILTGTVRKGQIVEVRL
jgi:flagella basal body P-ring formation protein FlgA